MVVGGIDPGFKGGLAFWDGASLRTYAMPILEVEFMKKGKRRKRSVLDLTRLRNILAQEKPDAILLEQVNARPGQGTTSMFRFGQSYGQVQGIVVALNIELLHVPPQLWKRAYALTQDKDMSLERARALFPANLLDFRLKKHEGVAEASLIARYGFQHAKDLMGLGDSAEVD